MPAERAAMRQVREIIRLKWAGVSGHEIARRVGVAPSTVRLTLQRVAASISVRLKRFSGLLRSPGSEGEGFLKSSTAALRSSPR